MKNKKELIQILSKYFCIGNSYTYELMRHKDAFEIGTMSLDDFVEWNSSNIEDLAEYIFSSLQKGE